MPRKRKDDSFVDSHGVTIEFEGRKVSGTYSVSRGMITVSTPYGRKITQVGGSTPASLARIMLRELAREGNAS
jgi:hypothetical protein